MAYFDAAKATATVQPANEARTLLAQMLKTFAARLGRIGTRNKTSPENLIAAQRRAEAHRRAVDNLLR